MNLYKMKSAPTSHAYYFANRWIYPRLDMDHPLWIGRFPIRFFVHLIVWRTAIPVSSSRSRPISNSPPIHHRPHPSPPVVTQPPPPLPSELPAGPPCSAHESAPVLHLGHRPLLPIPSPTWHSPSPLPSLYARAWRGRLHSPRDGMSLHKHKHETPAVLCVVALLRARSPAVPCACQDLASPFAPVATTASISSPSNCISMAVVAALEGDVRCQLADPCWGKHSPSKQPWHPTTAREAELKRPAKPLCVVPY